MSNGTIVRLGLDELRAHPMNANAMDDAMFEKLVGHMKRTGRYPPLIVRPLPLDAAAPDDDGAYQVLDGHHRWKALAKLGAAAADCVVWDADDTQSLVLLTTLNRLEGSDDPRKRGRILVELEQRLGVELRELAKMVPESTEQLLKLIDAAGPAPRPLPPPPLGDMPTAVTFFLSGNEKEQLGAALERIGGRKEQALMSLVRRFERKRGGAAR